MSNWYLSSSMIIMCRREQVFSFSLFLQTLALSCNYFLFPRPEWWWSGFCPLSEPCMYAQLPRSCTTLCDPMDCMPGSSVHEILPGKNTEVGCMLSSRGSFQPRDWTASPMSPVRQMDSLPLSQWGSPTEALINILPSPLFFIFMIQSLLTCLYLF